MNSINKVIRHPGFIDHLYHTYNKFFSNTHYGSNEIYSMFRAADNVGLNKYETVLPALLDYDEKK